jgi:hypothetical protein
MKNEMSKLMRRIEARSDRSTIRGKKNKGPRPDPARKRVKRIVREVGPRNDDSLTLE